MSNPHTSTWMVDAINDTPDGETFAELSRVQWSKPNPDHDPQTHAGSAVIPCEPGEHGADWLPAGAQGELNLNITDGPDLHAGDNVRLTVEVIR